MLIYLLRHGETEYNAAKRYQGTLDIPLSEDGRAALTAAPLSPDRVWVSPLCRAVETAKILFPHSELIQVDDLREMCFGSFQGKCYTDMEHDPDYIAWVGKDCSGRCPGGESRAEFTERSCAAFTQIVDEALSAGRDELVIVAHGGTQMAVLERYAVPHRDYYAWCAGNAAGYLLDTAAWRESHELQLVKEVSFARVAVI